MRVGLSLLTLSPGDLGGSETYARQLVRSLVAGRDARLRRARSRAREGRGRRASRDRGQGSSGRRSAARCGSPTMALQARRTKDVGDQLSTLDVVHYPLTVPSPRVRGADRRDAARHPASRPAGVLRACAALVPPARVRPRRALGGRRDRHERVRPRARTSSARSRSRRASTSCRSRSTTASSGPATRSASRSSCTRREAGRTRTTRDCSRPSQLLRETRPQLRLILTGGGLERLEPLPEGVESLGRCPGVAARVALPTSGLPRLPEPLRGVRDPAARSDGVRLPGRGRRPPARSRRCAVTPPSSSTRPTWTRLPPPCSRPTTAETSSASAGSHVRPLFTWDETARRHEDVYRAAASATPVGSPTTP